MAQNGLTPRRLAELRVAALMQERASWLMQYREISAFMQPMQGRFVATDTNKGHKRHQNIYDRTPMGAARTAAAGLMSGITSPARPWFRLTHPDPELREYGPVKSWLHRVSLLLREVYSKSNTYRALQQGYSELVLFGTWGDIVLPNFDNVIHHYPLTVGQYALGANDLGVVDSLCREYQMQVGAVVKQFGIENVSSTVKNLYDRHSVDAWVPITHLVEPNENRNVRKADNRNMRWRSCYFESAGNRDRDFLREAGFKRFPVLAPRWEVVGQDIYGSGPGAEALGDSKQLQFEQMRKAQGIDYQTNPPIQVPIAYKDAARSRLPGGVMYVDNTGPGQGVRTAYDVNLDLGALREDIMDVRQRINLAFYVDLFRMLIDDPRQQPATATEVAEKHEEKLLMLGPTLERLNNEMLSPFIDLTFDTCSDAGILPPAPPEMQGAELQVEFIGVLAQAQRAVATQGMDRLLGAVGTIAGAKGDPGIWDKIDTDQAIDDYAEAYGVNPEIVITDDEVAKIRAQRAAATNAAQAAAAAPVAADAAKTISETDPQGLRDVMGMFQGYGSPTSTEVA